MTVKYEVREISGHGLSLGGSGLSKFTGGPTVTFGVFNGERRVWSTETYFTEHLKGRQKNGLRLQASNMAKRYQSHFDRTGKCFEHEQDLEDGKKFFEQDIEIIRKEAQRELAASVFDRWRARSDPFAAVAADANEAAVKIIARRRDVHPTRYKRIEQYAQASKRDLLTEVRHWFERSE